MTSPTTSAARILERFDRIRDGLSEAGYSPIDCLDLPDSPATASVEYYELRGWDAVRHNGDTLSFARFGDEGSRLMITSLSGVIYSEASFSDDEHGAQMFVDAARSFPGEVEQMETTLEQLARDVLGIPSLDEQGRDSLDFHEVSVVSVRAALAAAYLAGKQAPR